MVRKAQFQKNYYYPPNLIFQHLPVKQKIKKWKVTEKINGYNTAGLTGVDIQESAKIGGFEFTKVLFIEKTLKNHLLKCY